MASTLSAGDIAIIGYLAGGNASSGKPTDSSFSFIALKNIEPGTDIYFTNNGWTGSTFNGVTPTTLNGAEEVTKFTTSSSLSAGTIIRSYDAPANWTTSGSIISGSNNGSYSRLNLATPAQGGDQITAFQVANPTTRSGFVPLYQLDYTGAFENATNANTGSVVPGLSNASTGENANTAELKSNLNTFGAFNTGALSSANNKAEWLEAVSNDANWTYNSSSSTPNLPSGPIALNEVPEPITMFGSLTALVIGAGLKQFRKKFQ